MGAAGVGVGEEVEEAAAGFTLPETPEARISFAVDVRRREDVRGVNERLEDELIEDTSEKVIVVSAAVDVEVTRLAEAELAVGDAVETVISVVPGAVVATTAVAGMEAGRSVENVFIAMPGISVRTNLGLRILFDRSSVLSSSGWHVDGYWSIITSVVKWENANVPILSTGKG